jgi:hypothetical protein
VRTFYMNEASLVLPDGAVDRSTTHVLLSTPSGARATFVVERLDIEPGQTLREAYLSYVRDLQRRLSRFSAVFERESSLDGAPALEIGVRWRSEAGDSMYTRQAHLRLDAAWVIVAIEGPSGVREELDGLFDPILASMRLRSD